MNNLNKFEMDVILKMLSKENDHMKILKKQLAVCEVEKKITGVGFFITFKIPRRVERIVDEGSFRIGNVQAEIKGLKNGAGFLLYVKDGALDMLEGYSYDEAWPKEIEEYRVFNV